MPLGDRVEDTLVQNGISLGQLEGYTGLSLSSLEAFIRAPSQDTYDALFEQKDVTQKKWENLNFLPSRTIHLNWIIKLIEMRIFHFNP